MEGQHDEDSFARRALNQVSAQLAGAGRGLFSREAAQHSALGTQRCIMLALGPVLVLHRTLLITAA